MRHKSELWGAPAMKKEWRSIVLVKSQEERISSGRGNRICKDPEVGKNLTALGVKGSYSTQSRMNGEETVWQTQGKEAGSQSQGSVGQSKVLRLKVSKPWPTGQNWPALPSVSINHALLEHSHTHSYLYRSTHGPGLLSGYNGRAKYVQQTPHSPQPETYTLWPFTEKVCWPLV